MKGIRGRAGWRLAGFLAIVVVALWLASRGLPDGRLHVYFLDVGQGDAILMRAPDGRKVLIDGGPSPAALLSEIGALLPFWDRRLDLVVLTHPDGDHMTGLVALLERYHVTQVLDTIQADAAPEAAAWREELAARRIPRSFAERGMRLLIGDVVLTVLNPGPTPPPLEPRAGGNDASVVLRIDYGETSMLLSGDVESEGERKMLAAGLPLRADVLKVGHHGSRNSTSAPFLTAVAPSLAVIQVGAGNRFGHPHADLLARLANIRILRTDRDGRIGVTSNGQRLSVNAQR